MSGSPREVFGEYVSIYDFQQSVEDRATVPLFYENRSPELRLENPNLNDDIYHLIEAAELDEEQEKRLETSSSPAMTGWRRSRRISCSTYLDVASKERPW